MEETELKVHVGEAGRMVEAARLAEALNKREIGRVVETRQVEPRKRVKLVVQEPRADVDYKEAFDKLHRLVNRHDAYALFLICAVCCHAEYGSGAKKRWEQCVNCADDLCPACLPEHQSDTNDQVHLFYCHACRERVDDTPHTEPGYQEVRVQFACYSK